MGDILSMLRKAKLSERQTRAMAYFCFDNLTQEEIAEREGVSQQVVARLIAKAQSKLSKIGLKARRLRAEQRPALVHMDTDELDSFGSRIVAVF